MHRVESASSKRWQGSGARFGARFGECIGQCEAWLDTQKEVSPLPRQEDEEIRPVECKRQKHETDRPNLALHLVGAARRWEQRQALTRVVREQRREEDVGHEQMREGCQRHHKDYRGEVTRARSGRVSSPERDSGPPSRPPPLNGCVVSPTAVRASELSVSFVLG